jgi:hypothetical protein
MLCELSEYTEIEEHQTYWTELRKNLHVVKLGGIWQECKNQGADIS